MFTWKHGDLLERLDGVLCNAAWQALFPDFSITNLPIQSSDHLGLWLRPVRTNSRQGYFKFPGPWIDHPEFKPQVLNSWKESQEWNKNILRTSQNLSSWNREVFGNIFRRKHRILRRLEGIDRMLLTSSIDRLISLREQLW